MVLKDMRADRSDERPGVGATHDHAVDLLRIVGIAGVILTHVSGNAVVARGTVSPSIWWVGNILDSLSRYGVPLFIMVSGQVVLASSRTGLTVDYYLRRVRRIGVPFVLWHLLYIAWITVRFGPEKGIDGVLKPLMEGQPFFHLYFLVILAGLYLVAPFLLLLARRSKENIVRLYTGLLLVWGVCRGVTGLLPQHGFSEITGRSLPFALTWLPFVGYFLGGWHLRNTYPSGRARVFLAALAVCSLAITALGTEMLYVLFGDDQRVFYFYSYLSPTSIVLAGSVFALTRGFYLQRIAPRPDREKIDAVLRDVGSTVFGIYLCHPFVMDLLGIAGLSWATATAYVGIPLTALATFLMSFVLTKGLMRMPGGRFLVT